MEACAQTLLHKPGISRLYLPSCFTVNHRRHQLFEQEKPKHSLQVTVGMGLTAIVETGLNIIKPFFPATSALLRPHAP